MLLAVVAVSAAIGWAISSGLNGASSSHDSHARLVLGRHHRRHGGFSLPRGWSLIAVVKHRTHELPVYSRPGHGARKLTLPNPSSIGVPLTLLVHRVKGKWVQAYLPVRPDGSKGWVSERAVKLITTAYELQVHLRRHRLAVVVSNHVVHTFRIGVGRSVTPTPSGKYFITELLKQPDPAGPYGPYAFGLSAYSGVLTHFGRGGNGQIGIHGTDAPTLVGTDVSHGCIRLRNSDVLWLVHRLPLGTPVLINRV